MLEFDDGRIVIDELIGYLINTAFPFLACRNSGFFWFRF